MTVDSRLATGLRAHGCTLSRRAYLQICAAVIVQTEDSCRDIFYQTCMLLIRKWHRCRDAAHSCMPGVR